MKFDKVTKKIMALVQEDNQLTNEKIGKIVGASPSTVQRRLKKLRSLNIIEKDISVLSPKLIGQQTIVIMEIEMERENPNVLRELKMTMSKKNEVMQCYYVTGRADFIAIMVFSDMEKYEKFCDDYITGNKNIKKYYTSVVISRLKYGLSLPIDDILSPQ